MGRYLDLAADALSTLRSNKKNELNEKSWHPSRAAKNADRQGCYEKNEINEKRAASIAVATLEQLRLLRQDSEQDRPQAWQALLRIERAVRALAVELGGPPVRCIGCRHFTAHLDHPTQGVGTCGLSNPSNVTALYANALRNCPAFDPKGDSP